VDDIPLHTQRLVERLLQNYCDRICPPSARNTVLLRFELGWDRATILELQRLFGIPGTGQPVQDDRRGDQVDLAGLGGDIGQHAERIGTGRVVGEVVLDRPDEIEAHRLCLDGEPGFLHEGLPVRKPVQILVTQMQSYPHNPCLPSKHDWDTGDRRPARRKPGATATSPTHLSPRPFGCLHTPRGRRIDLIDCRY